MKEFEGQDLSDAVFWGVNLRDSRFRDVDLSGASISHARLIDVSIDALLSREEEGVMLRDTDRAFARLVGAVLSANGAGSEQLADAHVVAAAVEVGGGVVVSGDPADMSQLSSAYRNIVIETLPSR